MIVTITMGLGNYLKKLGYNSEKRRARIQQDKALSKVGDALSGEVDYNQLKEGVNEATEGVNREGEAVEAEVQEKLEGASENIKEAMRRAGL